jgi:hypothetical protein
MEEKDWTNKTKNKDEKRLKRTKNKAKNKVGK